MPDHLGLSASKLFLAEEAFEAEGGTKMEGCWFAHPSAPPLPFGWVTAYEDHTLFTFSRHVPPRKRETINTCWAKWHPDAPSYMRIHSTPVYVFADG